MAGMSSKAREIFSLRSRDLFANYFFGIKMGLIQRREATDFEAKG